MKIERGNYPGASPFAYFDKPVSEMSHDERGKLLEQILFQAMPGDLYWGTVYGALAAAEKCVKEQP